jgi:hypothetical protein
MTQVHTHRWILGEGSSATKGVRKTTPGGRYVPRNRDRIIAHIEARRHSLVEQAPAPQRLAQTVISSIASVERMDAALFDAP